MPDPDDLAEGAIDDTDVVLLQRLRRLVDAADPVPADLALRSEIAITVAALEAEVAQLVADAVEPVLRAEDPDPASTTTTDTITFAGATASLSVLVDRVDETRVILDGWVIPGGAVIEIHGPGGGPVRTVTSTDTGRFVVDGLPTGPTWFVIRRDDGRATVTPVVEL